MQRIDNIIKDNIISSMSGLVTFNNGNNVEEKLTEKLNVLQPSRTRGNKYGFIAYNNHEGLRLRLLTLRFLVRQLDIKRYVERESAIRAVANNINMHLFTNMVKIRIVKGKEITKAYEAAVGNCSCMTGDHSDYTLLYEQNPDKVQMIIARCRSDSARALLWKLDCGKHLVSRVYYNSSYLAEAINDFAKKRGFLLSKYDNEERDELKVSGLVFKNGHIPYIETLSYGTVRGQRLDISTENGDHSLDRTDGCLEDIICCENCGKVITVTEEIYHDNDEDFCLDCFQELFEECHYCGEIIHREDVCEVEGKQYCPHCELIVKKYQTNPTLLIKRGSINVSQT